MFNETIILYDKLFIIKDIGWCTVGNRLIKTRIFRLYTINPLKYNKQDLNNIISSFVRNNLIVLEMEFKYWQENHTITVKGKRGKQYTMFRYNCEDNGPRPESYFEDYTVRNYYLNLNNILKILEYLVWPPIPPLTPPLPRINMIIIHILNKCFNTFS